MAQNISPFFLGIRGSFRYTRRNSSPLPPLSPLRYYLRASGYFYYSSIRFFFTIRSLFRMHKTTAFLVNLLYWEETQRAFRRARRVSSRRQRISPMAGRLISFQRNKATEERERELVGAAERRPVGYKRHCGSFASERARVQPPVSLLPAETSPFIHVPADAFSRLS